MGINPLSYLRLHNVGLRKMLDIFNYKLRPTCLFDLVREENGLINILTNPNTLPSALGRNLEYLAPDQESPNVCGEMSLRHGGWRELPGMETV